MIGAAPRRLGLFRRAAAADRLPEAVAAAIDSASLVSRSPDDLGPRVIVQMLDGGGWICRSRADAKEKLARLFPSLTGDALNDAASRLLSRVKLEAQQYASRAIEINTANSADLSGRPWRDRY